MIWEKEHFLWNRKWLWILIILGAGLLLSYLQPLELAEGGEVTFLSMLAVCMAGYFFGGWTGLLTALIFGCIKFLLRNVNDSDNVVAELYDYILGYGLLGACGFLCHKKEKDNDKEDKDKNKGKGSLWIGYLLAVLLRYVESVWNCSYFYDETIRYSLVYSSYICVEMAVTLLILCIPQVREAIEYLKYVATHAYEEDLDTF